MVTWQCIQLCMYLLAGSSFLWSLGSCVLGDSLSSQIKTIKVSNVSLGASERYIMEFFSFSGDIEYVELKSHDERSQIAYVTFKDSQGAESAVLLSGATIVDLSVNITPDPDYRIPATALASSTTVGKTPGGAESALRKAKDVVTSMLAKGFILSKDAVNKAKTFDEKLQITSTASAKVTSFDQKLGLSEKISAGASVVSDKVREVDQKFQVSEKTKSAFAAAEQKVSTAGSAIMKNRYVHPGASWVTGAFNMVAKAAGDVGQKTKEKVENTKEEQKRKVEDQFAQVLSESPKAAVSELHSSKLAPARVVESPNSNSNSRNAKAFSPIKKFLMQSYYDRHTNLHDSDFENFMSQEVPFGLCEALPNNHNFLLRPSVLKRNLIGEGSHRSVSTLIKFQTQQSKSLSELLSYSCEFIIIERLSSGVFADPFELQRLVQRGVFNDIAVFGDTNLELPSFLSNRSAVEIHLDVDPNILLEPSDIKIELPLHARYQPLNESGYSTVEFGAPDMLVRCSTKENVENRNCFFKLKIDDANLYDAGIVWSIPSGRKVHAEIVSGVTFIAALLSTLVIVVTSLYYSNSRLSKDLKQS